MCLDKHYEQPMDCNVKDSTMPSNIWHDMNDCPHSGIGEEGERKKVGDCDSDRDPGQLLKLMAHTIHALLTVAWRSYCKKDSKIWLYHTPRCCGSVVLQAPILGWWSDRAKCVPH